MAFRQGLIVNFFYSSPITIAKLALSAGRIRSQFVNSKLDTSLGVLAITMAWFGTKYAAQSLAITLARVGREYGLHSCFFRSVGLKA
jgi:hypothetical protein